MAEKDSVLYRDKELPVCALSILKCEKDSILTIEIVST